MKLMRLIRLAQSTLTKANAFFFSVGYHLLSQFGNWHWLIFPAARTPVGHAHLDYWRLTIAIQNMITILSARFTHMADQD
jgi:hypothetical protein